MEPVFKRAIATAPASVGNVGVGYDVLGLAFATCRDRVTATVEAQPGVRLGAVSGLVDTLPAAVEANCALAAAKAVLEATDCNAGLRIDIEKNVPISAGMGGSAASAAAAAGAVNALLGYPFSLEELVAPALEGERVSADPPPFDNVIAAIHGGLVIAGSLDPILARRIPTPGAVTCLLFLPERKINTRDARALLKAETTHELTVEHSRRLAAFVAGCAISDLDLVAAGLDDLFIEPQRLPLLPELAAVQGAALAAGALGCSFSGSGPSVFAWAPVPERDAVLVAMADAFEAADCPVTAYEAPLESEGLIIEQVE